MYNNIITKTNIFYKAVEETHRDPGFVVFFVLPVITQELGLIQRFQIPFQSMNQMPYRFDQVDIKPQFNDRDVNDFSEWVINRFKIPDSVAESDIIGRVVIRFTIGAMAR